MLWLCYAQPTFSWADLFSGQPNPRPHDAPLPLIIYLADNASVSQVRSFVKTPHPSLPCITMLSGTTYCDRIRAS